MSAKFESKTEALTKRAGALSISIIEDCKDYILVSLSFPLLGNFVIGNLSIFNFRFSTIDLVSKAPKRPRDSFFKGIINDGILIENVSDFFCLYFFFLVNGDGMFLLLHTCVDILQH